MKQIVLDAMCKMLGHKWVTRITHVAVRAGPLMRTMCERCGASPEPISTKYTWYTDHQGDE